ncbi:hypothetical protein Sya03_09400 [Spirilliplanes yamanashiensis]|uniref:GGDEF domain-containing protein n=2 Tax=Spirilliplanes yamanashiensis TaxID=42233 RepID=A0A8J4DHU9_9ACTN|nr:hypothetical protein Sya03_09400 [Spirilliplanes yamanashiensis]
MLFAGGAFPIVLSLAVPVTTNGVILPSIFLGALAMAVGGWCFVRPQRVPRRVLALLPPFGTALIGMAAWLDGTAGDGSEMLYVWPVLLAAYFLSMRAGLMNVAIVAVGYPPLAISILGPVGITSSVYLIGTLLVTVMIVSSLRRQLARVLDASEHEARTDRLTGLTNRRGWDEDLHRVLARQQAHGQPVSVVMIDLDHFKRLNDTHGHAAGDAALAGVAQVLQSGVRPGDVLARLGGEEIGLLLPGRGAEEAASEADVLRRRIEQESSAWPAPVTVSIGVAGAREDVATGEALMEAADSALYAAKRTGRNRVAAFQPA